MSRWNASLENRLGSGGCRSLSEVAEETGSVRNCACKILCDSLSHVSERFAHAEVHGGARLGRVGQDRDVLARMVGGGPSRVGITAVIRGDHQQIGGLQKRQECG